MSEDKAYETLKANVNELVKTKQGQDFIWFVLDLCGLYSDSFTGDNQTFYLEGKKSIGLGVLELLEDADPTIYPKLLLKHNEANK